MGLFIPQQRRFVMGKVYQVQMGVDGSCLGNPGPGGYAAILLCNGNEKVVTGSLPQTTSNRMELAAVIAGVKALKSRAVYLVIYTDSQYVAGQLAGNRTRANADLVAEMRQLMATLDSWQVVKVAGHAGDPLNERCDQMARAAAEMARAGLAQVTV
jgi:ribonuclease HI